MSRRYSSWRSLSSPNIRSSSTSEKPITAFSGVRSSCDMLARNSDLWRLAISSSLVLVSSSRNSRALTMASADWLAKVWSSSIRSGGKVPVPRRRITSTPTISSPRSIGTASTERQPSRNRMSRWGSTFDASARSGDLQRPAVDSAVRPTSGRFRGRS